MNLGRIAKFLTALAGAGAQIIGLGLAEGTARGALTVAISVLTAAAVFMVPNTGVTGVGEENRAL